MDLDTKFFFKTALNTSTLRPFNLDIKKQIEICAKSGYQGIELWISDIKKFINNGGKLIDLRKYIEDLGIKVINGISFFKWTDADNYIRKQGFEQAKEEMEILAAIGCHSIAAPPAGNIDEINLDEMASNFEKLVRIGREIGVEPYLEIWGHAKKLSKLSHAVYVIIESGVYNAKVLLDVFHLYKGGNDFEAIQLFKGDNIGLVHINDYPAYPSRDEIADRDRVFPGDGVAPLREFLKSLKNIGYNGYLSLELFVQDYQDDNPLSIARYGYSKIQNCIGISE